MGSLAGSPMNYVGPEPSFTVNLPFSVTLFTTSSRALCLLVPGVIALRSCDDTRNNGASLLAFFFDHLAIFKGKPQGIDYEVQGIPPSRSVLIRYYLSAVPEGTASYKFSITFYEDQPGIVLLEYYDLPAQGVEGSVYTAERGDDERAVEISLNQPFFNRPIAIRVDTLTETFTSSDI